MKKRTKPLKDLPLRSPPDLRTLRVSINLKIERREGCYFITSDEVPGLMLAHADWDLVMGDLPGAVRQLLRANCGLEW